MSETESKQLTGEALRLRVAELCGWMRRQWTDRKGGKCVGWVVPGTSRMDALPNYATSYDAIMPEILKRAEDMEWARRFESRLVSCVPQEDQYFWARTPTELCGAFIKTEEELRK